MAEQAIRFKTNSRSALTDEGLQRALEIAAPRMQAKRAKAVEGCEHFEALRDAGAAIKDHCLAYLDEYLEQFEVKVEQSGGTVHWCATAEEAREVIAGLCQKAGARHVAKSKSMVSEEIELRQHLEEQGMEVTETDLGEYAVQLADEKPSHIIGPALHMAKEKVIALFRRTHKDRPQERKLEEVEDIVREAREELRQTYLNAEVGITGANFLLADSGSLVLVSNEGNADLGVVLPKTHIALTSIDKVVPGFDEAAVLLRLLGRSGTGQEMTVYTSILTGPKRKDDLDGPEAFHVVLLDHRRSEVLGTNRREILRCIKCGACMNHCPVYLSVGGHAYGAVYPGPMGQVLTPALQGIEQAGELPYASTFCGKCEAVCPVKIPLPGLMRHLREEAWRKKALATRMRFGMRLWAWAASRPGIYRKLTSLTARFLNWRGGRNSTIHALPFAKGWTDKRDLPAPESRTFMEQYREGKRDAD